MNNDITLIMNPTSKSGKGKKNWKFFKDFKKVITTSRENAIDTVINLDSNVIVAVGGDGTINQCVNGIMKSKDSKILGVLYSGTSPDFCKFHNIPIEPQKAVEFLKRCDVKEVDVCKIIFEDKSENWFSSSCNIGLGAKIAGISNKIRRYFGDFLGTFIALVYSFITANFFDAKIEIGEKQIEFKNLYHLLVVKNNYIASGLKIGLNCESDDGKIYIIPIFRQNIFSLINTIKSLYKGDFVDKNILECDKVFISTSSKQYIEFDGDNYPQTTPVTIECCKKSLKLIK